MESPQFLHQRQEKKHTKESLERQRKQPGSSVTSDQNMCTAHDQLLQPRPSSMGKHDNTISTYESDDSSNARQDTESSSGAGYQADDSSVSSSQQYIPPLKVGKRRANPQHISTISCRYQHQGSQDPSQDNQIVSPSHGRRRRVKIQTKPTSVATFYDTVNGYPSINQQQQQLNLHSIVSHPEDFANGADKPDNAMQELNNFSLVNHNDRTPHGRQHVRHIHIDKDSNKKQSRSGEGVGNGESAGSGGSGTATHEASDIYSSSSIGIDVYVNLLQACRPFFTEIYGSATDKIFSSFQSQHHSSTTPADPPTQNICSVTQMNHEREESHRHIQLHKQQHLQPNSRESSSDGESPWGGSSSSMGEGRVDPRLLEQEQRPTNLGEEPNALLNAHCQDLKPGMAANSNLGVISLGKIAADTTSSTTGYHGYDLALSRNVQKAIRANQDAVAANRDLVRNVGATVSSSRAALVEDSSKSKGSNVNRADSTSNSNGAAGLSHMSAARGDRALVGNDTSSALNKTIDTLNKDRFTMHGATTIVTKTATEFSSSGLTSFRGQHFESNDSKIGAASHSSFPHAACLRHTTSNISSLSSSQKDSDENLTLPDNETLRTEFAVRPNKRNRSKSTSDSGNSYVNVATKPSGIGATGTTSQEDASSRERPGKHGRSISNVCNTNPGKTRNTNAILHPGHLLTLEDVMTVSNVPRLVTKSSVPFTVVYGNAAYTRLSGYDTHYAVGKSLPSLIKILPSLPPPPPCEVTVLISKSEEDCSAKALELLLRPRDGVSSPFHVAYLVCSGEEEGNGTRQKGQQLSSSDLGSLLKCYILIAPIVRNLNRNKRTRQDTLQQKSDTPFVVSASTTATNTTHPAAAAATNATNICAYYLIQIIQEEDPNIVELLKEFRQVTWNKTVG